MKNYTYRPPSKLQRLVAKFDGVLYAKVVIGGIVGAVATWAYFTIAGLII